MLRLKQFTKLIAYDTRRWFYFGSLKDDFRIISAGPRRHLDLSAILLTQKKDSYSDAKQVGGKKKLTDEQKGIKSHPCTTQSPSETSSKKHSQLKLKECKPISINPCGPPSGKSQIPSIKSGSPTNLMSELPQPKCNWEEHDKKYRKKGKIWLWLGILLTAASIGTLWYIGLLDYKEPVEKKKKPSEVKKGKRVIIRNPKNSSEIPKDVPYLLIGGGTASFSAFRAIKSADPTAKVLVLAKEGFFPYMRPPLSKEIWFNEDKELVKKLIFKQWNGSERSLFYEPEDFYTECKDLMQSPNGGVAVARGWSVIDLDVIDKVVTLDDGAKIHYNKCLIATGSTPKLSPVFQVAVEDPKIEERVKIYRNIYDFEELHEAFDGSKSIAVVGGGFLGSELACAMARKGKKEGTKIYQIFKEGGNMGKILPEYLSYWTTDKVKAEGVQVLPKSEVIGVKLNESNMLTLTLSNGQTIRANYVIVAVGVDPNTEFAEKSGLEVDPALGGYLVNTELQARSDLYIAGDCSCFYDAKLGRRRIEHHDHAVVTGRLAGENMAGGRKPYLHQSMFWSDLGPDVGYEAIGIVDSSLPTVGVFAKATDKDNPKAAVTATDEGIRSNVEEVPPECDKYLSDDQKKELAVARESISKPNPAEGEDFGKGVIFYLRNDVVVGIVLWNVFNRMSTARQVLKDQKKYDDLNEVAKLFNIHEEQ